MPIYDYECKNCGHEFSLTMAMAEYQQKKPRCPKCKSVKVNRLITSVSVKTSRKS